MFYHCFQQPSNQGDLQNFFILVSIRCSFFPVAVLFTFFMHYLQSNFYILIFFFFPIQKSFQSIFQGIGFNIFVIQSGQINNKLIKIVANMGNQHSNKGNNIKYDKNNGQINSQLIERKPQTQGKKANENEINKTNNEQLEDKNKGQADKQQQQEEKQQTKVNQKVNQHEKSQTNQKMNKQLGNEKDAQTDKQQPLVEIKQAQIKQQGNQQKKFEINNKNDGPTKDKKNGQTEIKNQTYQKKKENLSNLSEANLNNIVAQNIQKKGEVQKNFVQTKKQKTSQIKKVRNVIKDKQIPVQNDGLPNIGNTCFLNSIIQLLVSSKSFRESILSQYQEQSQNQPKSSSWSFFKKESKIKQIKDKKSKEDDILQFFTNIFYKIVYGQSLQEKRKTMKKIVQYLSKNSIDYQISSQQNSLYSVYFLMFLLNKLFKQKSDLEQLFKINFKFICKNQKCNKNSQFQQYTLDSTEYTCTKCHETNMILFLNQPKAILFMGAAKNQVGIIRQSVYFKKQIQNPSNSTFDQTKDYLEYKLKAKILYSGNGRSGHYIAARRKINEDNQQRISNAQFYEFNDSSLHKEEQMSIESVISGRSSYFTQKVCLYQLSQSISEAQYQKRKQVEDDLLNYIKEQKRKLSEQRRKKQEEQRKKRQERQEQRKNQEEQREKKQEEQRKKKQKEQRKKKQEEQRKKKQEKQQIQRQKQQTNLQHSTKKSSSQENPQTNLNSNQSLTNKNIKLEQSKNVVNQPFCNLLNCCTNQTQQYQFKVKIPFYASTIIFSSCSQTYHYSKQQIRKVHFIYKNTSTNQGKKKKIYYLTPQEQRKYLDDPNTYQKYTNLFVEGQELQQLIQQIKDFEKNSQTPVKNDNVEECAQLTSKNPLI